MRKQIAMVTQETALFNRSARDNIMYGNPNATEKELIRSSRQAEAHEFIQDLEDHRGRKGYDAHLGEQGVKLSGGQRQRVAIGRSIVRKPIIFLFDEPLSNLDAELRMQMRVELSDLHEELGNTMIYVTHDQIEASI